MKTALIVGGCTQRWHRIETSGPIIKDQLERIGFEVTLSGIFHPDGGDDWTGDYGSLNLETLRQYDLLVLMTTDDEHHKASPDDICTWVEQGGALAAVHGAAASFRNDTRYVEMLGAAFRHHPPQLTYTIHVVSQADTITNNVQPFSCFDELYLFERYDETKVNLLAETEEYENEGRVPVLWTKQFGKGRLFYLAPGHNPETLELAPWQTLFARSIRWCLHESQ